MPNDNQNNTNPVSDSSQDQSPTQPITSGPTDTTTPFGTENIETPPPPIPESAAKVQEDKAPTEQKATRVDIPPVVVTSTANTITNEAKKYSLISKMSGKRFAAILGILLLVGGIGAGVFLTKQNQDIRERAIVEETCSSSSIASCANQAWGSICNSNSGATCSEVAGEMGSDGLLICQCQEPVTTIISPTPLPWSGKCESIKAYSVSGEPDSSSSVWTEISLDDDTNLEEGDIIYFVAKVSYGTSGTSEESPVDKAKFTINGVEQAEAAAKTPVCTSTGACAIEFYQKYTIPSGVNDFTVTAALHLEKTDTWF